VVKILITPFCFFVVLFYANVIIAQDKQEIIANVVVLPFKIYSSEKDIKPKQNKVITLLSEVISENGNIWVVPEDQVKKLISSLKFSELDQKSSETISLYLRTNFVIFGSLTSLGKSLSLDARIFNNFGDKKIVKAYVEGKNFNPLIRKMGEKLRGIIIDSGKAIPVAERPDQSKQEIISRIFPKKLPPIYEKELPEEKPTIILKKEEKVEIKKEREIKEETITEIPEKIKKVEKKEVAVKREGIVTPGFFSLDKSIHISSESFEADDVKKMALFRGNVKAIQKDMSVYSKEMIVYYDVKGDIKEIVAIGNVRIKQKDRIVSSNKAIFANKERKVTLIGNPRIWYGEDMISGEKIIVFLDQDKIIIEGSKKNRVKAIITPKGTKK